MKKAVYHGIRDVRVEDVDDCNPGPQEVKIKVKYCGICGSDRHEYLHGLFPISYFGHEVVGEIVELGSDIEGFEAGDRVLAVTKGGYAEYVNAPLQTLFKLSDDISWKRAVVMEPLSGAAHALEKGGVKASDTILIAGGGTVGLMVLLGAKALGIKTIYVTDLSPVKLEMAKKLAATAVFNPKEGKISARIKELTDGKGVDVSIEAVGIEPTLKDCLSSTRHGGTVIIQGIFTEKVSLNMLGFVSKEMHMVGANFINPAIAFEWIKAGNIEPESIITSIIPLKDIVTRGFEAENLENEIKILVEP